MKVWLAVLGLISLVTACSTTDKVADEVSPPPVTAGWSAKSDINPRVQGTDCQAHTFEVQLMARVLKDYQDWLLEKHGRYASSLGPLLNDLKGVLRYNVAFLQTKDADAKAWSFYTPYSGKPDYNQHNLFALMAGAPQSLTQDYKQKLWIDSRYQTEKYTPKQLKKQCGDCLAYDKKYKAAVYSVHPNGKLDFWTVDEVGNLKHVVDACVKM